ncbi:MAG TPA: hypothetical protein PLF13_11700 [candidate division Zixibacteria bacterium]|nr:hypothetical protein [candidate division Zixibacteria bacterium]
MFSTRFGCLLCICFLFFTASAFGQNAVTLDHVDGLSGNNTLAVGSEISFYFRLTNNTGFDIMGATNGFRVYSPDGAEWQSLTTDSAAIGWEEIFDGGLFFTPRSVTGNGSDTVGFGGFRIEQPGIPNGFSQIVYTVTTQITSDFKGRTLCIDSCYYPPSGFWFWSHAADGNTVPDWDGPHCFEISGCCQHIGDINHSGTGPDISDLVYLVAYMFQGGPEPVCFEPNGGEADINGSGSGPDISDLVYLVAYMFQGGAAPANCL